MIRNLILPLIGSTYLCTDAMPQSMGYKLTRSVVKLDALVFQRYSTESVGERALTWNLHLSIVQLHRSTEET